MMDEDRTCPKTDGTTATAELRSLLDERGVEWEDIGDGRTHMVVNGRVVIAKGFPSCIDLTLLSLTPAQAVEATLGRGTCENVSKDGFRCSECGESWLGGFHLGAIQFKHCPSCGREVMR